MVASIILLHLALISSTADAKHEQMSRSSKLYLEIALDLFFVFGSVNKAPICSHLDSHRLRLTRGRFASLDLSTDCTIAEVPKPHLSTNISERLQNGIAYWFPMLPLRVRVTQDSSALIETLMVVAALAAHA